MLDFNALKAAVAELDEEKVLELLNNFVAANPTPEEAQRRSRPARAAWPR